MKRLILSLILLAAVIPGRVFANGAELPRIHEMLLVWDEVIDLQALNDDSLLVSTGSAGMHIVDVSDPTAPKEAGIVPLNLKLTYFSLSQETHQLLGVVDESIIAALYDITDPSSPVLLSEISPLGDAIVSACALYDSLAFISVYTEISDDPWWSTQTASSYEDSLTGMYVYKLTDPANPTLLAYFPMDADPELSPRRLGDVVYYIARSGALVMINLSDPDNLEMNLPQCFGNDFDIAGEYICVGRDDGLHVYNADVSAELDFYALDRTLTQVEARDHVISVMLGSYRLGTFDVSDPANLTATSWKTMSTSTDGWWGRRLLYNGDFLYALSSRDNINVFDVSDSSQTLPVATFDPRGLNRNIVLDSERDLAWLSTARLGLLVLDISDIEEPTLLYEHDYQPAWMQQVDTLLYYTSGENLWVMSIADPANPVRLGGIALANALCGLQVRGTTVYTATRQRFYQVDFSDPAHPEIERTKLYDSRAYAADIEVRGDYAYLCFVQDGLYCIDLADPELPVHSILDVHAMDCQFVGETAYIAAGQSFVIADYTDPATPVIKQNRFEYYSRYSRIAVDPPFAYLGDSNSGLTVYSFADPEVVHVTASCGTTGEPLTILPIDDYLMTANSYSLSLFDRSQVLGVEGVDRVSGPQGFSIEAAYPNPFNSTTTLSIRTQSTTHLTISIFDLLGREVESIDIGQIQPGMHTVSWRGENLASGVYFVRVTNGHQFGQTRRITLLR